MPGSHRDLTAEGRRSLRAGSWSTTATSTTVQGSATHVRRGGSAPGSSLSRGVGVLSRTAQPSPTTAEPVSSLIVELPAPKVELDDDDHCSLDQAVPISTPLPPKRASTPRTPSKARGAGHVFSPGLDNLASDDVTPFSSPLPPRQPSSARGSSTATSRNNSTLSVRPSRAGSRASAAARSRTATPSSASAPRAVSNASRDATPPPSSAASSASATHSRTQSETPDLWRSMSQMSSLSPTPSEVGNCKVSTH